MGCFGYICKECGTAIRGDSHDGGEKCVLIHVRHGKEIGRAEGHYNEYGSIVEHDNLGENERFRGDGDNNPNSHREICHSELSEKDSYYRLSQFRLYDGDLTDFYGFVKKRLKEELRKNNYDIEHFLYHDIILDKAIHDRKFSDMLSGIYAILKKIRFVDKTEEEKAESIRVIEVDFDFMCNMFVDELRHSNSTPFDDEWSKLSMVEMGGYSGVVAYHSCCYRRAMRNKTFNLIPSESDPNQSCGKIRKKFCK